MKNFIYVVFEENVNGENDCSLFDTYSKALDYFNSIKSELKYEKIDIECDKKDYFQWFDCSINEFSASIQIFKKEIK